MVSPRISWSSWPALLFVIAAVVAAPLASGCIVRSTSTRTMPTPDSTTVVRTPFKAHLRDGSVVLFPGGASVTTSAIVGTGSRYDLTRTNRAGISDVQIPLDSVLGLEAYQTKVHVPESMFGSVLLTGTVAMGTALAAVAIFGSCPTIYVWSDSLHDWQLDAEAFSNSVGPAFEQRDVDRLGVQPGPDGGIRIEVRNEALETHYVNQFSLIEVHHAQDEVAVPSPAGVPIVAAALVPPTRARDRAGRDVLAQLQATDSMAYATDRGVLASATSYDFLDTLELTFPAPPGADTAVLVLRLRNSLLTTTLLYHVIMSDLGPGVLDWFMQPRTSLWFPPDGAAYADLAWIHISERREHEYRPVASVNDAGPLAWREVAVVLPVLERDSVVVRLTFPADITRIDRVTLGRRRPPIEIRRLAVTHVRDRPGREIPGAVERLAQRDSTYIVTGPGTAYRLEFEPLPYAGRRTFFISTTGYYIEWARPQWFHQPYQPYTPNPERLVTAMRRWQAAGPAFEERFYASRIPVR